jgi:hypothetical protein
VLTILAMLARDRARCAWLRVALLLPSPSLRAAAWALPRSGHGVIASDDQD